MKKPALIAIIIAVLVVYGCANSSNMGFMEGIGKIDKFDEKYNSSIKMPPATTAGIDELKAQLTGFKAANKLPEPLNNLVDFRIAFLDAEKLNAEGWQWGKGSTTEFGFGCKKGYERIKESARLRNASAQKGYGAVDMLESFVEKFPNEAKIANLTQKDVLALNAMYFQIEEKAKKDLSVIESFCGKKNESKEVSS